MKKILLGTTAILAAGVIASSAQAAGPIALQLGGYANWYMGAIENDDAYVRTNLAADINNFDVLGDAEVHFAGESTLDNGLTVGVKVELEADTGDASNTDTVDESYAYISGNFGKVEMGNTNNAAYKMHSAAKDVGALGVQETDLVNLVLVPGAVTFINATAINTDSDSVKVSYFSPEYYGFQVGASYAASPADITGNDATTLQGAAFEEAWIGSVGYKGEFAGVGVNATVGYATITPMDKAGAKEDNRQEVSASMGLTYGAYSVAGGYKTINDDGVGIAGAADEGYAWNAGVAYENGPWGASVAYINSRAEGVAGVSSREDEVDMWLVSGNYNLGAGVDSFATFGYADYNEEAAVFAAANNNDGYAVITGLKLNF